MASVQEPNAGRDADETLSLWYCTGRFLHRLDGEISVCLRLANPASQNLVDVTGADDFLVSC